MQHKIHILSGHLTNQLALSAVVGLKSMWKHNKLSIAKLGLRANNEACNILVLKCFGFVKPSNIVIVTPKPIAKLQFGFGILP